VPKENFASYSLFELNTTKKAIFFKCNVAIILPVMKGQKQIPRMEITK